MYSHHLNLQETSPFFFFFLSLKILQPLCCIKVKTGPVVGLSVGFLASRACLRASELLGFTLTGLSYQQGLVILDKDVFDLFLEASSTYFWEWATWALEMRCRIA